MKIVLFLGAGFSKAFGHPVMNEFFAFADSSTRISPEDKDFIKELLKQARIANAFLESSPTNLEDILSFSEMEDRLSLNENQDETNNQKIRLVLQRIYTDFATTKRFWERFDNFPRFLSFNSENILRKDLSIVTTNYDLSIECALLRFGSKTKLNFDYATESTNVRAIGTMYLDYGVPVFKLHGSVNWFQREIESNLFVEEIGDDDRSSVAIPYVSTYSYPSPNPPLIIPPSFLKPDLHKPLGEVWKGAAKKLQEANLLVFIGYSFPLSDTEMTYFLARSLSDNAGLHRIVIIDPSADEIKKKINSPESKFGSHFKGLLHFKSEKWQDINLMEYLG